MIHFLSWDIHRQSIVIAMTDLEGEEIFNSASNLLYPLPFPTSPNLPFLGPITSPNLRLGSDYSSSWLRSFGLSWSHVLVTLKNKYYKKSYNPFSLSLSLSLSAFYLGGGG